MIILLISILVFLAFRLINLNIIPIFADEAIYIHWAQIAWHDHTQRFISLTDGKPPLHTWLMIPWLKIIKDPLIAGRMLSVFAGLLTLIGVYLIVKRIFTKHEAIVAAFLVALCPYLVFYDRLAVADSLLTVLGVWSFYLALELINTPDLGRAFLLGFCWAGGLLTKQPGWYFIILFPSLLLLTNKIKLKPLLFYSSISFITAILGYNLIKLSPYSHLISARSYDYVLGKKELLSNPFQLLWGNIPSILLWLNSYQTWFGTLLLIAGVILLIKHNWKKALVFGLWIITPILGSAAIGKIIFPRYFLLIQPWVIIIISFCIIQLIKLYKKLRLIICSLVFIPWLIFSILLVTKPEKAPLAQREQDQYLTTWAAGYGIKEIAIFLKTNYPKERVDVGTEGYFGTLPDGLQVYLDGYLNINVFGVGQPLGAIPTELADRAILNPTFLVVNNSRWSGSPEHLELIGKYTKPEFPFLKESLLFFQIKPNDN